MKKPRPGESFEQQFLASCPPWAYARKLRTPSPPVHQAPRLLQMLEAYHDLAASVRTVLGTYGLAVAAQLEGQMAIAAAGLLHKAKQVEGAVPEWARNALRWSRFTSKAGYDVLLAAPAPGSPLLVPVTDMDGEPRTLLVQPSVVLALELKSIDGSSLPWSNAQPEQERALREVAAKGNVAGFLVEFRGPGEAWFVPICAWDALRQAAARQSLSVAAARQVGIQLLPDLERGKTRRYWRIGEWLERFGAGPPAAGEAGSPVKAAPAPKPQPKAETGKAGAVQPSLFG